MHPENEYDFFYIPTADEFVDYLQTQPLLDHQRDLLLAHYAAPNHAARTIEITHSDLGFRVAIDWRRFIARTENPLIWKSDRRRIVGDSGQLTKSIETVDDLAQYGGRLPKILDDVTDMEGRRQVAAVQFLSHHGGIGYLSLDRLRVNPHEEMSTFGAYQSIRRARRGAAIIAIRPAIVTAVR